MNKIKQDKSKTNKNSKIDLQSSIQIKQKIDYFIVGPDKEAGIAGSAKTIQEWEMNIVISSLVLGAS